jgi:hypothetical protein
MNLDFLDEIYKPIGKGFSEADTFMNREMPFNMSWGFPAALVAAYFGGPMALEAMGQAGGASSVGAAEGTGSVASGGGFEGLGNLFNMGGENTFQTLPSDAPLSQYTPDYLNRLADYQGVDAGNASYLDRLLGNTEQGLYKQEGLAQKASGQTLTDLLKKKQQQSSLDQLSSNGTKMQEQNNAQQAEQNRMAQQQAMMRRGQPVDTTTAILSLLQDKQQSRQPRISLI